jgi:superfamily II DNA/RNA helicase
MRSFSKNSFPRQRPSGRKPASGSARRSGAPKSQYINASRFIQKAEITEKEERFVPEHSFSDFKLRGQLADNIAAKGYKDPTPIQDRIIPHVLRGSDVVGIANTGTGKTAAFLIPLIEKAMKNQGSKILVLAPTRELATQIDEEFQSFAARTRIASACCTGGASTGKQLAALRRNPAFVIGTPGRIKDFIERKAINLAAFSTLVLDEADRMLDMGFIRDVRSIVGRMPKKRHTLFFSATMSHDIERLIGEFLNEPVSISVRTRDTSKNVDQDVVKVERKGGKVEALHKLLRDPAFSKVLIFGRTKHGVEALAKILAERGFSVGSIHGNKSQSQREKTLALFKKSRMQVLVATDVAARGLDVPDITHVINYDIPATYDDYVHRIGRTGRGEKKGKALTFLE